MLHLKKSTSPEIPTKKIVCRKVDFYFELLFSAEDKEAWPNGYQLRK